MFVKIQKPDRLCRHKNNKAIRLAEDFDSNGRLTALFKIALCVERCHAPRASARHRLAVDGIGTVAGGKDALDVGGSGRKTGLVGHDIAALSVELFGKDLRVGRMTDGDEDAVNREFFISAAFKVLELETGDALVVAQNFFDFKGRVQHDLAFLDDFHELVDKDGFGLERAATVHKMHNACNLREIKRFFNGRIAAASS